MSLFVWNEDYMIKVPSIDAQHQRLVEMLNDLHDAMAEGKGNAHLSEILRGLVSYTAEHFAHEEELFAQLEFPLAAAHIREHEKLKEQVVAFQKKFDAGEAMINMALMRFLKDWLINHILGSDKKYAPLFIEKRVP